MTLSRYHFEAAGIRSDVLNAAASLHVDWTKLFGLVAKYGPVVLQVVLLAGQKNWAAIITLAATSAPGLIQDVLDALGIVPPVDVTIPAVG